MNAPEIVGLADRGLDLVLGGGSRLVERVPGRFGATILIRGSAGSGKTLLGIHTALALARARSGAVAYGCVEILPSELETQVGSFPRIASGARVVHADAQRLVPSREVTTIHARVLDLGEGVDALGEVIQALYQDVAAKGVPPKVLVIDSLSDGYKLGANASREFADAVCKLTAHLDISIVLLEECASDTVSPWVFAADTVLELGAVSDDVDATRSSPFERRLVVVKHRFGPSDMGPHRFSLDPHAGIQVYPRPSAWLEPWSESLQVGVARVTEATPVRLTLPLQEPMKVDGLVVAVHGPDLQQVFGIAMGVFPLEQACTVQRAEVHIDFGLPLGQFEDVAALDGLHRTYGVAHPYLSAHRLLRLLLDEVRASSPVWRVIVGDLQSLRSFWDEGGLRRALGVFCILMRRQQIPVILYESAPSRVTFSPNPSLGAGLPEARSVDLADVSVEVMADSRGQVPTLNKIVVTQRRRGVIETVDPTHSTVIAGRARLQEQFRVLAKRVPTHFLDKIVVFGSGAVGLRGVDLGRAPADLDLFVSTEVFKALAATDGFSRHEKAGPRIPFLTPTRRGDIEFWEQFPGVDFTSVAENASAMAESFGLKVASLSDLRRWKEAQIKSSPRDAADKHRGDLAQIDAALKRR